MKGVMAVFIYLLKRAWSLFLEHQESIVTTSVAYAVKEFSKFAAGTQNKWDDEISRSFHYIVAPRILTKVAKSEYPEECCDAITKEPGPKGEMKDMETKKESDNSIKLNFLGLTTSLDLNNGQVKFHF